jgi:aminopeptidase N
MSFAASLRHSAGSCRCRSEQHGLDRSVSFAHGAHGAHQAHAEHGGHAAPPPFAFPGTKRVYERDRPFRIEHIALDLTLDLEAKGIFGHARLLLSRVSRTETTLLLDAVAFEIAKIELAPAGGKPHAAKYSYDDEKLRIEIARELERFELVITYRATPKRGLYFLSPDEHVQDRPRQVWSQCQDEDARAWFPCHDKPHVKQTSELRVNAPKGWYVLSNGTLVDRHEDASGVTFHWKQSDPHSSYLVTLAAGEFSELVAPQTTDVPVTYLVPKGREDDGWRAFARTPEMIALFEKKTGVKYPWAKYAQIVVSDFIFGGMENTSATTMYEHILLDRRAAIDVDMDGIVAHELAHQWFGDYVTCRDWSEAWLNEGWATYMELVWKEEGRDAVGVPLATPQAFGRDEYDYAIKGELDIYLAEDASHYRRPIVCRDYDAPIELFDRHLYQKGGLVLHHLRRAIGDDAFWGGVHNYLARHALGIVESRDFQRALEETSGRSLDRIFDLYVHGAGHPDFEVTIEHEPAEGAAASQVVVTLKQRQKLDDKTRVYEGPITIEILEDDGGKAGKGGGTLRREIVQVRDALEAFVLPTNGRPTYVSVDPDGDLLATYDLKVPADLLRGQLASGASARVRWTAATALAKRDEAKTIEALATALAKGDEFWGVRAEAAEALGAIRGDRAFDALVVAIGAKDSKVRRAIVRALGKFKTPKAVDAARPLALSDESWLVSADAARALGETKQAAAYETLIELLDRRAWGDAVRVGAADGLASLRDDRAVPHLGARTAYGNPSPGRRASIVALARIDSSRKTRELIEERLDDVDVFVRATAVRALELIGDAKARPALSARLAREDAHTVRRRIREALRELARGGEGEVKRLRDDLDKVRDEAGELKLRLSKLEAKMGNGDKAEAAKKPTKKAPAKKAEAKRPAKKSSAKKR